MSGTIAGGKKKGAVYNRKISGRAPSSSTFEASGDPESPGAFPVTKISKSNYSFPSTHPQAATGSTSQTTITRLPSGPPQAPGPSRTTGVSGLSDNPSSSAPQATTGSTSQAPSTSQTPSTSQATGVSRLSDGSFSPTPKAATGSTSQAPGTSQTTGVSGLSDSPSPPNPQATICSTFQAPSSSQTTGLSGSSDGPFSPTPKATAGSTSQAPGTSQTTGVPGLSNSPSSPTPQAVTCSTSQAPGSPQTTGTSELSDGPFSPTSQATAGSTSQATITSSLFSRAPQDTSTCQAPVASRNILQMSSKQSPPVPFDKFASSEISTIRVGTNLQAFHVHRDLLAGLSDEMRNYVYNSTKEGGEVSMEIVHISPDTMRRFMEFCYSGDYLYTSGSESNSDNPLKDKDATEALPLLLTHAKLYLFADMFNIFSLKELSRSKIIALTRFFGELEDRVYALAMISLMDYMFHNIPNTAETPDKLVKFLAKYAGSFIGKFGEYPEFHAVLAGSTQEDFFKVFCRWAKAGDEAPWADAE